AEAFVTLQPKKKCIFCNPLFFLTCTPKNYSVMSAVDTPAIQLARTPKSRLSQVDFNNLQFGQILSDHMLVAEYADGQWKEVSIVPYGDISISPSTSALHYGQSIFEGIKAYKFADGTVSIFRPDKNHERFTKSAVRLNMPEVPEEMFMGGLKALIALDRDWVTPQPCAPLSIR